MRGALLLTAAKTPYRRAGLAFPVGVPLTVAILSLTVQQLRLLLEDPQITVMVGQDIGTYVIVPELKAELSDDDLQAFIDAAPPVEIEPAVPLPVGPEQELAELRQTADETAAALRRANEEIVQLQDAGKDSAAALAAALADVEARNARIAELEADLAKAAKPVAAKPKDKSAD